MQNKRQRRHSRVAFAASVRLHSADRRRTIDGRSINLSHSGVLVESLSPCAVGTEVICEIPLPGGQTRLPGRVTRLQSLSPAAVGVGIEFGEVAGADEQRLTEVVGQNETTQSRVVQVRFEGMKDPLRSRAILTEDGIRLTTALPFLRLRSAVEVMFLSGLTKLSSRGVVRNIELDGDAGDGIPRLGVNVTLASEENVAGATPAEPAAAPLAPPGGANREEAAASVAAARLAADLTSAPFGTPAPEARPYSTGMPALAPRRTERELRPRRAHRAPSRETVRLRRGIALAWVAVGAGVAAILLVALVVRAPRPARSGLPAVPRSTVAAAPEARAPVRRAQPGPAPAAPALTVPAVPTVPPATAAPAASAPARPAPFAGEMPEPLPAHTPGPELQSDGEETTALVPVSGSTAGMTHHSLRSPRGMSVNLPRAQSVLAVGVHAINRAGLRSVWIRPLPGSGIQIRFVFERPTPDERLLELEDDAVRIRLRLPRPPQPPDTVATDVVEQPPAADADLTKTEEN